MQKQCCDCSCKGHIKANCPERRKLGAQPWKKRSERKFQAPKQRGKMLGKDNPRGKEAKGKKMMKRNSSLRKKQEVKPFKKPKNLQQMGKDF